MPDIESTADPETRAELNRALQQLFRRAFRNGVAVRGGHRIRNGDDLPDWDVEVVTAEKRCDESDRRT